MVLVDFSYDRFPFAGSPCFDDGAPRKDATQGKDALLSRLYKNTSNKQ